MRFHIYETNNTQFWGEGESPTLNNTEAEL